MASGCFARFSSVWAIRPVTSRKAVAHFLRRDLQTASHLRRETHQNVRVHLDQLTEFLIRDFGHFTCGFRPYLCATLLTLFKQA